MSYRPPSHPPVTAWARHLDAVMQARKWSRVRLFEEVGADLGYGPKSRAALLPYLVDKEPDEAAAAVFRRHFGDPPAALASAPEVAPVDPIVAAIDRLTAAVEAQGRQQQEGMLSLASVLGEVMHALGGLPGRTPDGSAGQSTGAGR